MGERLKLWIDTDVGGKACHKPCCTLLSAPTATYVGTNIDDAIALLVACAHPGVELVGVSTVGDDATIRATMALTLLASAGHGHVPVVAGPPDHRLSQADTLLAIGPLTNVAALGDLRPPNLVVMGGLLHTVHHRGEERTVEHNVATDPVATAAVLGRPGGTIVPLDVTLGTRLDVTQQAALVESSPILRPMMERWLAIQADAGCPPSACAVHLHDPAALLVALDDPWAGTLTEPMLIAVEPDGHLVTGSPAVAVGASAMHDVVVRLDEKGVAARVIELVGEVAGKFTWRFDY